MDGTASGHSALPRMGVLSPRQRDPVDSSRCGQDGESPPLPLHKKSSLPPVSVPALEQPSSALPTPPENAPAKLPPLRTTHRSPGAQCGFVPGQAPRTTLWGFRHYSPPPGALCVSRAPVFRLGTQGSVHMGCLGTQAVCAQLMDVSKAKAVMSVCDDVFGRVGHHCLLQPLCWKRVRVTAQAGTQSRAAIMVYPLPLCSATMYVGSRAANQRVSASGSWDRNLCAILLDVCTALDALHRCGGVHGTVCLQNVAVFPSSSGDGPAGGGVKPLLQAPPRVHGGDMSATDGRDDLLCALYEKKHAALLRSLQADLTQAPLSDLDRTVDPFHGTALQGCVVRAALVGDSETRVVPTCRGPRQTACVGGRGVLAGPEAELNAEDALDGCTVVLCQQAQDMWAFGVTVYQALTGGSVFKRCSPEDADFCTFMVALHGDGVRHQSATMQPEHPGWVSARRRRPKWLLHKLSTEHLEVLRSCMDPCPSQRGSAAGVLRSGLLSGTQLVETHEKPPSSSAGCAHWSAASSAASRCTAGTLS